MKSRDEGTKMTVLALWTADFSTGGRSWFVKCENRLSNSSLGLEQSNSMKFCASTSGVDNYTGSDLQT
jgi:hypothetical protein